MHTVLCPHTHTCIVRVFEAYALVNKSRQAEGWRVEQPSQLAVGFS